MEYEVKVDDVEKAWKHLCRAMRRHINAHGELPSTIFVSAAAIAAIQYGALKGMEEDIRIILVEQFDPTTNVTVA